MFDNLTKHLSQILHKINSYGRLTKDNIKETLQEVRIALLEADVALPVIDDLINHVREKAIGQKISNGLTPGQKFVKMVYNELIIKMGKKNQELNLMAHPPIVIMMVGPRGVGKTTNLAKLGKFLYEKNKKKILTVSIDIYRPAAIKQLEILACQVGIDFFFPYATQKPVDIAITAFKKAKSKLYDVLLIDTAGCSHVDEVMMSEIKQVHAFINPVETLFVIDAMVGQNAANIARTFKEILPLTGIILTKVDSDARGGAALSIPCITGKPIKFLSVGEKIEALEIFHPERIASRIMGMGDVLSIIEDIEHKIDQEKAKKITAKLKGEVNFNLTDLLEQFHQIKSIGGLSAFINKLPNIGQLSDNLKSRIDSKILIRMEAIICSMTPMEREDPKIIDDSRKRRIAAGCGMQVQDINFLLKQLDNIQSMIKKIRKMKWWGSNYMI